MTSDAVLKDEKLASNSEKLDFENEEVPWSSVFKLILKQNKCQETHIFQTLLKTMLNTKWKTNQSEIPAPAIWNTAANCLQTGHRSTKAHSVPSVRMGPLCEQPLHPKSRGPEVPALRWVSVSLRKFSVWKSDSFPDPSKLKLIWPCDNQSRDRELPYLHLLQISWIPIKF